MLDATQCSEAEIVVDIFEFMDLDPAVNETVHADGLRYHRQAYCAAVCSVTITEARYIASSLMPPNSPELRLYIQSNPRK